MGILKGMISRMVDFLTEILDYIIHDVYSIYLVIILAASGFLSFFYDTDHNYLFGHYKDYIFSFFFGIINIGIAILLIIVKVIHSRLVF